MLSPGVIIAYDSTHASIPSGWSRETTLDGRFVKGTAAATNPGTNGGASTHTHTSTAHTHTLNSHTHTFTLNAWSHSDFNSSNKTSIPAEANKTTHDGHGHTGTSNASSGGTTNSTAVTYGAVSNNPLYYEMIFIKATKWNFIPVSGVVFSKATTRPGLTFLTAAANRFIRGAGTGADAGTTGGSQTNTHDISHTHTTNTHSHTATSGGASFLDRHGFNPGSSNRIGDHTHTFSFVDAAAPIDAYSGSVVTTENVEPAYTTLNPYKNASASLLIPLPGDIAMWDGTLALIPVGWVLCDGNNGTPDMRSQFLKVYTSANAPVTGGSNTHTHATSSHSHTSSAHNHTASNVTDWGTTYSADNIGEGGDLTTGAHTVTVANTSATYASANTTPDASDNQPLYRTLAFIQFKFGVGGGALSGML